MNKGIVGRKGVAARFLAALMSVVMVFACGAFLQEPAHADDTRQIGKISFDGDADYEWAHYYFVDNAQGALTQQDLNIEVLDTAGETIYDVTQYDLTFVQVRFDEALGSDVEERVDARQRDQLRRSARARGRRRLRRRRGEGRRGRV